MLFVSVVLFLATVQVTNNQSQSILVCVDSEEIFKNCRKYPIQSWSCTVLVSVKVATVRTTCKYSSDQFHMENGAIKNVNRML